MVIILLLGFTFTASVDRTTVGVGQTFLVTIEVTGENLSGVDEPNPASSDKVEIIGKSSSHSTQIQLINGKFTKSTTLRYDYTMVAREKGEVTIPPFTIEYEGKEYSTEPVKIKVTESKMQEPIVPEKKGGVRSPENQVFIECIVSNDVVYPGEGVLITFELYTRVNLGDVNLVSLPRYENVWVEEVFSPKRLNFRKTVRNSIAYSRALIKKDLIFPLKAGEVKIIPLEMNVVLARDIFSFFEETRRISSPEKKIKVRAFPESKPEHFIDAVGDFEIDAELDTSLVEASTPFPLRVKITGSGNLLLLSPPEIPETRRMSMFRPESEEKTRIEGGSIKGERIFTYLITPEDSGFLEIPAIKWAFFNPEKKGFVERSVGPFRIRVEPPRKDSEKVTIKREDIAYIMPVDESSVPLIPSFFFLYLLLPLFILGASGYYVWEKRKLLKDIDYARIKAIPAELQKGFRRLQKEVPGDKVELFYEELSRLLLKFLKLRYSLNTFSLRRDDLLKDLKKKNLSDESLSAIDSILKRSEEFRFASTVPTREEMGHDLELLKGLIRDLH